MAFFFALGAHTHAQGVGEHVVYRLPFLARLSVLAHLEAGLFWGRGWGSWWGWDTKKGEFQKILHF